MVYWMKAFDSILLYEEGEPDDEEVVETDIYTHIKMQLLEIILGAQKWVGVSEPSLRAAASAVKENYSDAQVSDETLKEFEIADELFKILQESCAVKFGYKSIEHFDGGSHLEHVMTFGPELSDNVVSHLNLKYHGEHESAHQSTILHWFGEILFPLISVVFDNENREKSFG